MNTDPEKADERNSVSWHYAIVKIGCLELKSIRKFRKAMKYTAMVCVPMVFMALATTEVLFTSLDT